PLTDPPPPPFRSASEPPSAKPKMSCQNSLTPGQSPRVPASGNLIALTVSEQNRIHRRPLFRVAGNVLRLHLVKMPRAVDPPPSSFALRMRISAVPPTSSDPFCPNARNR